MIIRIIGEVQLVVSGAVRTSSMEKQSFRLHHGRGDREREGEKDSFRALHVYCF